MSAPFIKELRKKIRKNNNFLFQNLRNGTMQFFETKKRKLVKNLAKNKKQY